MVGQQRDVGVFLRRLEQCGLHRPASRVIDMDDAAVTVPAFAGEVQPRPVGVERHTKGDQALDRRRGALDDVFDRLEPVEPGAGDHCVANVIGKGIAGIEHRGDPALRPGGRTAVERALGQHRHLVLRRQRQRGGEPGRARADDENVGGLACHGSVMAGRVPRCKRSGGLAHPAG